MFTTISDIKVIRVTTEKVFFSFKFEHRKSKVTGVCTSSFNNKEVDGKIIPAGGTLNRGLDQFLFGEHIVMLRNEVQLHVADLDIDFSNYEQE